MILGEVVSPLSLSEDEENIGGHQKKRSIKGLLEKKNSISLSI